MKNKTLVLTRVEQVRQAIKKINYIMRTNGSFQELDQAFVDTYEILESMESLVNIESDPFHTNQIV